MMPFGYNSRSGCECNKRKERKKKQKKIHTDDNKEKKEIFNVFVYSIHFELLTKKIAATRSYKYDKEKLWHLLKYIFAKKEESG